MAQHTVGALVILAGDLVVQDQLLKKVCHAYLPILLCQFGRRQGMMKRYFVSYFVYVMSGSNTFYEHIAFLQFTGHLYI